MWILTLLCFSVNKPTFLCLYPFVLHFSSLLILYFPRLLLYSFDVFSWEENIVDVTSLFLSSDMIICLLLLDRLCFFCNLQFRLYWWFCCVLMLVWSLNVMEQIFWIRKFSMAKWVTGTGSVYIMVYMGQSIVNSSIELDKTGMQKCYCPFGPFSDNRTLQILTPVWHALFCC